MKQNELLNTATTGIIWGGACMLGMGLVSVAGVLVKEAYATVKTKIKDSVKKKDDSKEILDTDTRVQEAEEFKN